jgi:hypothetical protein
MLASFIGVLNATFSDVSLPMVGGSESGVKHNKINQSKPIKLTTMLYLITDMLLKVVKHQ